MDIPISSYKIFENLEGFSCHRNRCHYECKRCCGINSRIREYNLDLMKYLENFHYLCNILSNRNIDSIYMLKEMISKNIDFRFICIKNDLYNLLSDMKISLSVYNKSLLCIRVIFNRNTTLLSDLYEEELETIQNTINTIVPSESDLNEEPSSSDSDDDEEDENDEENGEQEENRE